MATNSNTTKTIAPEDLRNGQYVSVLNEICEHMPCSCAADPTFGAEKKPLRMRWLPDEGDLPMKVVEVCLPFVLAERADGAHRVIDVRRHQLAVMSERFGRKAFKRFKPKTPRRSRPASRK